MLLALAESLAIAPGVRAQVAPPPNVVGGVPIRLPVPIRYGHYELEGQLEDGTPVGDDQDTLALC